MMWFVMCCIDGTRIQFLLVPPYSYGKEALVYIREAADTKEYDI